MSIIIKGMDKPKGCYWSTECDSDCLYLNRRDVCMFQDEEFENFPIENELNWRDEKRGKAMYKNCPLVEIPKGHGRLIDGDEFKKSVMESLEVSRPIFDSEHYRNIAELVAKGTCEDIDNAPTILEAEQSQENTTEYANETQSKPTATPSTEVPWWILEEENDGKKL